MLVHQEGEGNCGEIGKMRRQQPLKAKPPEKDVALARSSGKQVSGNRQSLEAMVTPRRALRQSYVILPAGPQGVPKPVERRSSVSCSPGIILAG